MADRANTTALETFLVEHYRPGLTADELRTWAARMRDQAVEMEREGRAVRFVRATIVPGDESLLCFFEASSEQLVRDAYMRAGIPFERIMAVIPDPASTEEET